MVGLLAGVAAPAADVAGTTVAGLAIADYDNTGGADGDIQIEVLLGIFRLVGVGLAEATVGEMLYVVDDQTVNDDITATTNGVKAGTHYNFESATDGWVVIDGVSRGQGAVSADASDLPTAETLVNERKAIINTYL